MVESSFSNPDLAETPQRHRYLKPSVFWSIRQEFPRWLSVLIVVLALAVPLIAWSIASYGGWVPEMFLPTPTKVWKAGMEMLMGTVNPDGTIDKPAVLIPDTLMSCGRVLAGFIAAAVVGVPIGIAMGTFTSMESLFSPLVGTVRYMPVTGFVPLIVIWVGLGEEAKVLIIFLGVVLYNAIMVADAVKFIPNEMINVAYTLGAGRREVLFKVIIPATFPSVLDTLRVNISGAWTYLVIAELVAAQSGLGFRIVQAQRFLQTDKVLFCIGVIGVIGLLLDFGLKWISKRLTPWADQARH
jgi:NitT/TauT family transport system permease protein